MNESRTILDGEQRWRGGKPPLLDGRSFEKDGQILNRRGGDGFAGKKRRAMRKAHANMWFCGTEQAMIFFRGMRKIALGTNNISKFWSRRSQYYFLLSSCLAILLFWSSNLDGQTTGAESATFQDFVNGKVAIKEAVFYREIIKSDGTVEHQDWWRFGLGLDGNTWYVQQLQPSTNDAMLLVSKPGHSVYGASSSNVWIISDTDINIVDRKNVKNSLLEHNTAYRNIMHSALSLGLPRLLNVIDITDAQIQWDGLKFSSKVGVKFDKKGLPTETVVVKGAITPDASGRPATATFSSVDDAYNYSVTYEYKDDRSNIPKVFVMNRAASKSRYEFLTMTFADDNSVSDEFKPTQFADMRFQRHVTLWSNQSPYSVFNGALTPAHLAAPTNERKGTFFLLLLTGISAAFLVLLGRHWKQQTK